MEISLILREFGLNAKEIAVYLSLLDLGPSPVRAIASKSAVNRGTTYDILKSLQSQGLVSFFNKQTRQYFTAEPPDKLLSALEDRQRKLSAVEKEIKQHLPELKSAFENRGNRPTVKLFEGAKGIKSILEDVLETVSKNGEKTYYVYSCSGVRENVYLAMPDFSKKRIKTGIRVKTISLGEGGKIVGLDERKWMKLDGNGAEPTYEIIYDGKVAHISLDHSQSPVGVVIQNRSIYNTQKMIFEFNWAKLV